MASATRLHYMTPDGGPPSQGRPPRALAPAATPSSFPLASLHFGQALTIFTPLPLCTISTPPIQRAVVAGLPAVPAPKPSPKPSTKASAGSITSHIKAKHHTSLIHLVEEGSQPWRSKGMKFRFKPYLVDRCLTVADLMTELKAPGSGDAEKGLVEMVELGDGDWQRGTVWKKDDEKSKKMLRQAGWTGKVKDRKPIWLAFWKEGGPN